LHKESFWLTRAKSYAVVPRRKYMRSVLRRLYNAAHAIIQTGMVKHVFDEAYAFNGKMNVWAKMKMEYIKNKKYSQLYTYYQSHVSPFDTGKPYVFFPLHFQPERSTLPLGDVFHDQFLAIEMISKALPEGCLVFVKEHPRQLLYPGLNALHVRSKEFYDKMVSLTNVRLIDMYIDTSALIDNAVCVATLTGSIGWEAMMRGKIVMVFGFPWYVPCASCVKVHTIEECKYVYTSLVNNKNPEEIRKDILRFIAWYKGRFIVSTNRYDMATRANISYEQLTYNLADAIIQRVCNDKMNSKHIAKGMES